MSQNHALLELAFGQITVQTLELRCWHLSSRPACQGSSVEENHCGMSNGLFFTGKSTPETIDFPMKIMGLSCVNFPVKTNPLFNEHSNGFPKKNHGIH